MNKIILKGFLRNIQYSHNIQDIEFCKAELITKQENGKENLINIKFKRFSNPYKDGDEVALVGNIRTYSQKLKDKNKVEVYVFTYFDEPEETDELNKAYLDGRICKKGELRKTQAGKDVIDFIIANNLKTDNQSLNCYVPCVAWGLLAKKISQANIGEYINVEGYVQSREYKKKISDTDFEIKIAHELNILKILDETSESNN